MPAIARMIALVALVLAGNAAAVVGEPGNGPPASHPKIAGRTLDEWRDRIKHIDPTDPASSAETEGLIRLIKNDDVPWHTRRQAALTLGRMGIHAAAAVPVLTDMATREDGGSAESVSLWAVKALSLYGPVAAASTPELVNILENDQCSLAARGTAAEALSLIGAANPTGIAALYRFLRKRPPPAPRNIEAERLYEMVLESAAILGPAGGILVPALMPAAEDFRPGIRRRAAAALGGFGSASAPAVPLLAGLMVFDEDLAVQDAATTAIGAIGAPATPLLIEALEQSEQQDVLRRSANALGLIGPPAIGAVPRLRLLLDPAYSSSIRIAAAEALWRISPDVKSLLPVLVDLLDTDERQDRAAVVRLLVKMAGTSSDVRTYLEHAEPPRTPDGRRALTETRRKIVLQE